MNRKNVLFIDGLPDDQTAKILRVGEDGSLTTATPGSSNIYTNLNTDSFNRYYLLLDANRQQKINVGNIHAVFNQISDTDNHSITLSKMKNIYRQLHPEVEFFNPPHCVERTTRDNIFKLLQDIEKVQVPKTVRFTPRSPRDVYDKMAQERFGAPVILRPAGQHGGIGATLIREQRDESLFYPLALDGRDYYLTQYIDYGRQGIYHKTRLIVVEGEAYIRHALFNDSWMVHASSRSFMARNSHYLKKEQKILESFDQEYKPRLQKQIGQIYERIGLDYFGIDCHIDEKFNMLIFELNASMNALVKPAGIPNEPHLNRKTDEINRVIVGMIEKRLNR